MKMNPKNKDGKSFRTLGKMVCNCLNHSNMETQAGFIKLPFI